MATDSNCEVCGRTRSERAMRFEFGVAISVESVGFGSPYRIGVEPDSVQTCAACVPRQVGTKQLGDVLRAAALAWLKAEATT